MKIVCVSASQVPSDTANSIQVMKVCQAFVQLGHAVTLLVPADPAAPPPFDENHLLSHYGLQIGFPVEWLPMSNRRAFPGRAVRRARALQADVLYAWPVPAAARGLLSGLPVLLEMHDLPSGRFGPLWYRLFLALPGRKRLLPITDALRRALEGKYGPPRGGEARVAPDGVDLERYAGLPDPEAARKDLGLAPGLTVACTGHLYAGRGVGLFLELAAQFPGTNFLWVGGRPADVDEARRRAAAARLERVTFAGFVPNARIPLYQSAAEVLLMPYGRAVTTSSGGNTAEICSPMKMFEYLAAGRVLLTSDLPVLREVLDERCAVFCPPEDADAWGEALGGLIADSGRRQALGRRAREVAAQYAWSVRARHILEGFET
jgi:glycosyltransferase involved in cell wall biosynthesis